MQKIGYLGPPGTFSHTAALQYAGAHGYLPVCCSDLETVFRGVENGSLAHGIVPVENSTGGSVGEALDLLSTAGGIFITGEMLLQVRQHLLVRPGTAAGEISRLYSHPQALAQCRRFIRENLAGVPVSETASTAAAALAVAGSPAPQAAVGSSSAAEAYGLEILHADIQDSADNVTRFLVLGRHQPSLRGPAKTSLVFAVEDRPGALYRILREFALRGINLTRIESRPAGGKLGDYIFFVDCMGARDDPAVDSAIGAVERSALWLKVLGSYPACWEERAEAGDQRTAAGRLQSVRKKIDLVDHEIVHLLALRQSLVEEVAKCKTSIEEIVDRRREEEIMARVRALATEHDLDLRVVQQIFALILQGSVCRQKKLVASKG